MGNVKDARNVVIIESAVDWLTLTASHRRGAPSLSMLGQRLIAEEREFGARVKTWRWREYQGEHAGAVTWGTSQQGDILHLSGAAADHWFARATSPAWRCTRIDLAVTVRLDSDVDTDIERVYNGVASYGRNGGFDWNASLIKTRQGGYTCYVGTRGSERFGRIYNKERESQDQRYNSCQRWEVELRRIVASTVCTHLAGRADRRAAVASYVRTFYIDHGIIPPWPAGSLLLHCERPERESDLASKLAWLANTVEPTVRRLGERGHFSDVLEVLFGGVPEFWRLLYDEQPDRRLPPDEPLTES